MSVEAVTTNLDKGSLFVVRVGENMAKLELRVVDFMGNYAIMTLGRRLFRAELDPLVREGIIYGCFESGGGLTGLVESILPSENPPQNDVTVAVKAILTVQNLMDLGGL